ncbi:MAG: hypothetical protein FJ213_06185 [Ignavibacteria bacterium]|nr:hypothetical protein [Ignavibacteria bacterium]
MKRKKMGIIRKSFIGRHLLINLPILGIGLLFVSITNNYEAFTGVITGYLLILIYVIIGFLSFEYSVSKSNEAFLKYYFGGMMIRMFLLLILIFFLLKNISINKISLLFSLLIFYVINLVVELQYVISRQKRIN